MRKSVWFAVVLGSLLPLLARTSPAAENAEVSPWPMLGHDGAHTNRSDLKVHDLTGIQWKFKLGKGTISGWPVVGPQGAIYVLFNGTLFAVKPDGKMLWKYTIGLFSETSPAIGPNGTVYVDSSKSLFSISPTGEKKWAYAAPGFELSSPVIAGNGTVLIGSKYGGLYAVNPDGSLRWRYETLRGSVSTPAVDSDGVVYAGLSEFNQKTTSISNYLGALDLAGHLKWKTEIEGKIAGSPAIAPNGTIYFVCFGYTDVYAIDKSGRTEWKLKTGTRYPTNALLAVGRNGTVYLGSSDGLLSAVSDEGKLKWKAEGTGATIDGAGTVYFAWLHKLVAMNPDGTQKWQLTFNSTMGPPIIGSNGVFYIEGQEVRGYTRGLHRTNNGSQPASADRPIVDSYLYAVGADTVR